MFVPHLFQKKLGSVQTTTMPADVRQPQRGNELPDFVLFGVASFTAWVAIEIHGGSGDNPP